MMKLRSPLWWKILFFCLLLGNCFAVTHAAAFTLPDPVSKNFTDNHDGTVTCHDTDLMWEVKGGPGTLNDADRIYSWDQAQIFIAQLNTAAYAGYSDWRLPKICELGYIVNYAISSPGPVIDTTFFPNCRPAQYWSATPYAVNNLMAWYFCFIDASRKYSGRSERFYVRAVREVK